MLQFDYTLPSASQRVQYISDNLSLLSTRQLESAANYMLHPTPERPKSAFNAALSPKEIPTEEIPEPQPNLYLRPKLKPLWNAFPLEKAWLEHTKAQLDSGLLPSATAWAIRNWRLELQLDIGTLSAFMRNAIPHPSTTPAPAPPIDLEQFVDLSDPFHIKHILMQYSTLRQSDTSRPTIEWVEYLIDHTPLKAWQRALLIGRIENIPQATLAIQIAQTHKKILSPSYMSQAMRNIYGKIAAQHTLEMEKFLDRKLRRDWKWETCSQCHQPRQIGEFRRLQLDRAENNKPAICRICEEHQKK